ncbi:MAG: sulfurtransferase [Comamonadaceae bacterium CG1_02_60_18]|nr:MAG: sulfurtransferase [Comamonadaceae bacterium CG1_02_60_18]PIQ51699.1 MAG: sulfurtransferase [Comamonadaceae bacterium CG12_big_fil_rev_8_21_14_0_65_59_15]PIW13555.1 MAG: sulfurtransferase [Armatimonadetes bacterium CG17_big_fil_post_rev_8_21_14_2_50_66_6]
MYTTLISVPQLQALQKSSAPLVVFDCSFELSQPAAGDAQYAQCHIAGALRADLDRHLSAHGSADAASGGRHPLPAREKFAAWIGAMGVQPGTQVVTYDRQGMVYCGRLWWMLKWLGHDAVAVLDGGFQAWQDAAGQVQAGHATAPDPRKFHASNYPLAPTKYALVAADNVAKQLGQPQQTILDARGAPRFRGEVEPLDPVAGHIPGALNRVYSDNLTPQGCFKSPAQLRREFEALLAGRDSATVVHHCGSGVSAIPNLIAMEIAGFGPTTLYAGSWSDWCSDPRRPVAQG